MLTYGRRHCANTSEKTTELVSSLLLDLICNKRQLARQIVDQMFVEYRRDEYCNTNLSFGACNSRSSIDARENVLCYLCRRHPDANIFRQLKKLPSGTESMISTTLEKSDLPQNVRTLTDKDAIIAEVV